MGLRIDADDDAPIPRPTSLTLTCDQECSGLFGRRADIYNFGGYAENIAAAKRDGWLERNGSDGRKFICPECSGKAKQ